MEQTEQMEQMELAVVVPGGGTGVLCNRTQCSTTTTRRCSTKRSSTVARKSRTPEPWPPRDLALPDSIEAIEAGRVEQRRLFDEQPDDSRAGRLARILAGIPGTTTADRLTPGGRGGSETFRPTRGDRSLALHKRN